MVAHDHVLAQDALKARSQGDQRPSGTRVAGVGLELDAPQADPLEGVFEQQQLGLHVHPRAPGGPRHPGPADLRPQMLKAQLHKARRAQRAAVGGGQDRERDGVPGGRGGQGFGQPLAQGLLRGSHVDGHPGEHVGVAGGRQQSLGVLCGERLDADHAAHEGATEIRGGEGRRSVLRRTRARR